MSSMTRLKRRWRRMVENPDLNRRRFIEACDKVEKRRTTKDRWRRLALVNGRFREVNLAGRGLIHNGRKP